MTIVVQAFADFHFLKIDPRSVVDNGPRIVAKTGMCNEVEEDVNSTSTPGDKSSAKE